MEKKPIKKESKPKYKERLKIKGSLDDVLKASFSKKKD